MKFSKIFSLLLVAGMIMTGCSDDNNGSDNGMTTPIDQDAQFTTADQMGRPAVNTVFLSSSSKNSFNTTVPSGQSSAFRTEMETNLATLSPAYAEESDMNALGQNRDAFIDLLATDVLNVSLTSPTTFYDGTNLLTGRNLTDDVITVELILIFGGETGLSDPEFPGLSNDKAFLATFPYLAAPF